MKKLIWIIAALLLTLPSLAARANGEFTYVTVRGPGVVGELTVSNPILTQEFFAFADFSQESVTAPADAGDGFIVTRTYVIEGKEQPFDQLQYYPYTGFVYYIGVADGTSEYAGKWYAANPSAKEPFLHALKEQAKLTWYPAIIMIILLVIFFFAYRKKA